MKILIHSNAPWVPSGYGQQTRLLLDGLSHLGHEVAVSAISGLSGQPIEWEGYMVLPSGQLQYGVDMLIQHARHWHADLVLTLMDFYQLAPIAEQLRELNVAAWLPVDCAPLAWHDRETLRRSGARPVAMSPFGLTQLRGAGFTDALYVPHAHDFGQGQYEHAQANRERYRQGLGIDGRFVVGICSANNDGIRKGFPEQLEAFARFHRSQPEALLMVHSIADSVRGLDLAAIAHAVGIPQDAMRVTDTYAQLAGAYDREMMADWLSVVDVLSCCSYAEAFGVPMLEAQAMGTPVISTRGSAMDDLRGPGWGVMGQPFYNPVHRAWWKRPDVPTIVKVYKNAYKYAGSRREAARAFAEEFHIERVAAQCWKPALEALEPDRSS